MLCSKLFEAHRIRVFFQVICSNIGANLVEIESPEEDDFIQSLVFNLTGKTDLVFCFFHLTNDFIKIHVHPLS